MVADPEDCNSQTTPDAKKDPSASCGTNPGQFQMTEIDFSHETRNVSGRVENFTADLPRYDLWSRPVVRAVDSKVKHDIAQWVIIGFLVQTGLAMLLLSIICLKAADPVQAFQVGYPLVTLNITGLVGCVATYYFTKKER